MTNARAAWRRSAERRSPQATIWPATAAPSTLAPSTTSTASSSCAAIETTGSLPASALERGSRPTTKSARSSSGSSEAGPSGRKQRQTEQGWGAPACARRASGLVWPDGVRAGVGTPAREARCSIGARPRASHPTALAWAVGRRVREAACAAVFMHMWAASAMERSNRAGSICAMLDCVEDRCPEPF